jgi:hypothetical protein
VISLSWCTEGHQIVGRWISRALVRNKGTHTSPNYRLACNPHFHLLKRENNWQLIKSIVLFRFIRARKHDLVAAKEMWKNYIEWRQEFGTDTIEKVSAHVFFYVSPSILAGLSASRRGGASGVLA